MALPLLTQAIIKHNASGDTKYEDYTDHVFELSKLPDLTGEDAAYKLILKVMESGKAVVIVSDYDSDGLNGAAVGYKALKPKYDNTHVITNKRCDSNGFNDKLMQKVKYFHNNNHIGVIITVDHGSACRAQLEELKEYGIDHVIITDHHDIPKDDVPDTLDVFINPQHYPGDPVGYCGTMVLFKVVSNFYKDDPDIFNNFFIPCLPHAAIATVSDVMDMSIPYNRLIVSAGLQIMNMDIPLWQILKKALGIAAYYKHKDIGFKVAPLINTGNRASREELIYSMLTETSELELLKLVDEACYLNTSRKAARVAAIQQVKALLAKEVIGNAITVTMSSPMAIGGIIANSIGELYQVPTTCFTKTADGKHWAGSARAVVPYVSISEVFQTMKSMSPDLFIGCGGHQGAGGCTIPIDMYDEFKRLFDLVVSRIEKPAVATALEPMKLPNAVITPDMVRALDLAGPYGKGWPEPKFTCKVMLKHILALPTLAIITVMLSNKYVIRGTLFYSDEIDQGYVKSRYTVGMVTDIVFEPQYYERNGKISLSFIMSKIGD